jgi:hypothetical protein
MIRTPLHALLRTTCAASLGLVLAACSKPAADSPAAGVPPAAAPTAQATQAQPDQALPKVTVYKSAYCGCCKAWIRHMEQNGFAVESVDTEELAPLKQKHGVAPALASCHTALVGGYVVEGHVPAAEVKRLLAERPALVGLAVPGMPMGSPGMEGPRTDPYQVLGLQKEGGTQVFARYP